MGRFRDAITGLFTTREHATANPDTTVRERRAARSAPAPIPTPVPSIIELTPAERQQVYDWAHRTYPELLARYASSPLTAMDIRRILYPGGPTVRISIEVL